MWSDFCQGLVEFSHIPNGEHGKDTSFRTYPYYSHSTSNEFLHLTFADTKSFNNVTINKHIH